MRDAANAALNAAKTASTTAGQYGSTAAGIGANLVPFLTRQMTNPQGMSQQDIGAQLTSELAGTGGATSGLTGAANKMATVTRNPMGFSAALDAAARTADKANAGAGERIAANNANIKLQQQNEAAQQLGGLYGTAGRLGVESQGQVAPDVNAAADANKTGWLQNMTDIIGSLSGASKGPMKYV
ncbi:MAG TPA: hypothetical protein VFB43_18005 [Terracidiphilus sp.]|nr:hypothetical protein [Terracidiphilus sp.]